MPFTVLVDSREKSPYRFEGFHADAILNRRPLVIPTEWYFLPSGDYSLKGCESLVAIERKSLADLYSTLGQHRERFEAEHERLSKLDFAAVVVEASLQEILTQRPERSRLNPKTVYRTYLSWVMRFKVPWFLVEGRRAGETTTFRLLEKYWHERADKIAEAAGNCRVCGRELSAHDSTGRGLGPVCAARGDRVLAKRIEKGQLA